MVGMIAACALPLLIGLDRVHGHGRASTWSCRSRAGDRTST